jgi:hypothetical protein
MALAAAVAPGIILQQNRQRVFTIGTWSTI